MYVLICWQCVRLPSVCPRLLTLLCLHLPQRAVLRCAGAVLCSHVVLRCAVLCLQNSAQPINVKDVLTKLMQHLEPQAAAALWQQFRAGAGSSAAAGDTAPLSQSGPVPPGAPNPVHAKINRATFAANSTKCGVCGETYHASFSPLVLCDFCPGAYHVCCLGLDWADLPEAEWACNK
jgi:hypothetical protein